MKPIDAIRLQLKAMELVEGTELEWWEVIRDKTSKKAFNYHPALDCHVSQYELALDIIEGKPVWADGTMYARGIPVTVKQAFGEGFILADGTRIAKEALTWFPSKPKTAPVYLLVEDIEYWIKLGNANPRIVTSIYADASNRFYDAGISNRFYDACRKTLDGLK